MLIAVGLLSITLLTVATGYFVAQEFAYVAVDRGRLRALAESGDAAAERALAVTARLSFMLSGAQLGITVTALLAGYVAEPYLGRGLAALLGAAGVPAAVSLSVSVTLALLFATVVQMVLGEPAPKNLAIARPETLARSTLMYLAIAGPLIRLFDAASNRLLRTFGSSRWRSCRTAPRPRTSTASSPPRAPRGCSTRRRRGCSSTGWSSGDAPPRTSWCRAWTW